MLLPVQAQPKAKQNALAGWHAGRLKVCLTAAPEKGKANRALLKLLAKALGLKRSQIKLLSGETSPLKMLCIQDIQPAQLSAAIAQAVEDSGSA